MEVESRLLLYVVLLACGIGIGAIVVRRSAALRGHAFQLTALAAVATAGLVVDGLGPLIAWPAFGAWAVVSVLPTVLVHAARRASSRRRYGVAAAAVSIASGLLFLPRPLRREARVYAALGAADDGDAERCRARIEELVRFDGDEPSPETEDLARLLPPVAGRRWDEVLALAAGSPRRTPLVVAAEATAAAEMGDLARAIATERELADWVPRGAAIRQQVRRTLLAEGGRAGFLEDAVARGLPVADAPRGAMDLAIGRARERCGETDAAAAAYRRAARSGRGRVRSDAQAGIDRCARGEARAGLPAAEVLVNLDVTQEECALEVRNPSTLPVTRRAPATLALCAVTAAASVLVFLAVGTGVLGLVSAGALSAPLVLDEGQTWRLATAMLLHVGPAHLLLNLASIFVVALPYEQRAGPLRTVVVYLGSGLLASAASVWIHGTDVGVGSSGAAMGMFGALVTLLLARGELFDRAERRRWLAASAVIVAANGAIGWLERQAIDNSAHAGGLVAGALLAWAMLPPRVAPGRGTAARPAAAAVLAMVTILSVVAAALDLPTWRGSREVSAEGATLRIPAWLHVESDDALGAIAVRAPLPFAVQWGRAGRRTPDPAGLVARALGEDPHEGPSWTPAPGSQLGGSEAGVQELVRASPDDEPLPPLRAVIVRRGEAFAVAVIADDPDGRASFGAWVREIARTLAVVPADPERSDAR